MNVAVRQLSPKVRMSGLLVLDATSQSVASDHLENLAEAVSLIGEVAPYLMDRLRRNVSTITIADEQRVEYAVVARSAFLPRDRIAESPHVTLAAILVGLSARARASNRRGGWIIDAVAKRRLVRIDLNEQLRFVRKLDPERFTNTEAYVAYLEQLIATDDSHLGS